MLIGQKRVVRFKLAINEKAGIEVLLSEPAEGNERLFFAEYPRALSHETEDE